MLKSYLIWKDGKVIANGCIETDGKVLTFEYTKKRFKQLNGNTLHIISGDVINVYHNRNNRVTFSHTFVREEK